MVDIGDRNTVFVWEKRDLVVMSDGLHLTIHHRGCGLRELTWVNDDGRKWKCPMCSWQCTVKDPTFVKAVINKVYIGKSYQEWLGNWFDVDPARVGVTIT